MKLINIEQNGWITTAVEGTTRAEVRAFVFMKDGSRNDVEAAATRHVKTASKVG